MSTASSGLAQSMMSLTAWFYGTCWAVSGAFGQHDCSAFSKPSRKIRNTWLSKSESRARKDNTHWRTGTCGKTSSTRWTAVCFIRRVLQQVQIYCRRSWFALFWKPSPLPSPEGRGGKSRNPYPFWVYLANQVKIGPGKTWAHNSLTGLVIA